MEHWPWLRYLVVGVIALVLFILGKMWPGWFDYPDAGGDHRARRPSREWLCVPASPGALQPSATTGGFGGFALQRCRAAAAKHPAHTSDKHDKWT